MYWKVALAIASSLALSCAPTAVQGPPFDGLAPSFSLEDVNDTSESFGQEVQPNQYVSQVSLWYFGHST